MEIQELAQEIEDEVWQSTTKCKSSVDKEDRTILIIKWSCCFHDINAGFGTWTTEDDDIIWEGGQDREPSTKE
jgi:hypothetical protein